ncbi:MAG: alpha/beta hydrolase [Planctomycetaceae bacterium]|nr:alpha/beta hydrolase [Planctomycetaceae bacterium]
MSRCFASHITFCTLGITQMPVPSFARVVVAMYLVACCQLAVCPGKAAEETTLRHGVADSTGVKIHFVHAGEGPLLIMVHGFPDYWYTWRDQIPALAQSFHVVAIDQRGYNKSDQPKAIEDYRVEKLVGDVNAVMTHLGAPSATILGHDWGGMVAWNYAMAHPTKTDRLVILNLPHPRGLLRELRENPQQVKNSQYARNFQQPQAAALLTAQGISTWVREPAARQRYIEAFQRSSFEGMLNYYKANYPRPPYEENEAVRRRVKCPTLLIHGLEDKALLAGALNGTWRWIDNELTLVTIPGAGHFVHRDKPKQVTRALVGWLKTH